MEPSRTYTNLVLTSPALGNLQASNGVVGVHLLSLASQVVGRDTSHHGASSLGKRYASLRCRYHLKCYIYVKVLGIEPTLTNFQTSMW